MGLSREEIDNNETEDEEICVSDARERDSISDF
jgi:hypothetical protein